MELSSVITKNTKWSNGAFLLCLCLVVFVRLVYHTNNDRNGYNATTYDALGYYAYNPGLFIYGDLTQLEWLPKMDSTYQVTGGEWYQFTREENGNYVCKYLMGVSLLQLPSFFIGHGIALLTDFPADGFSAPYQYAILWGSILWFLFGLWVLKRFLRTYYSDKVVGMTLIALVFATNLIQYVSVDGAMSHVYIFPLYAMLLEVTRRWHVYPKLKWALAIGFIIGLAVISRPTELIMVFIPLFWRMELVQTFGEKRKWLWANKKHLFALMIGGIVGILPQLIYWRMASGDWIYNVGSKWTFLNPWWRVLFGFEKGWFIYTPIVLFFVIGLFFLKKTVYGKGVLVFFLLNIYVVISWFDWQYGASYSTRALTQSYPVLAIGLAAFLARLENKKTFWGFGFLVVILSFINLFQIGQYNRTDLHYRDMNAQYYSAIFLKNHPSILDYSLLDTDEMPDTNSLWIEGLQCTIVEKGSYPAYSSPILSEIETSNASWVQSAISLRVAKNFGSGQLVENCYRGDSLLKQKRFRLGLPGYGNGTTNRYQHFVRLPKGCTKVVLKIENWGEMDLLSGEIIQRIYR